ncbi:hypothetical protein HY571_01780 [Candidatus Micrarchaeota archaeon]|nr:hypothetical protein [Candidatus Micrarchaeota archaeon]
MEEVENLLQGTSQETRQKAEEFIKKYGLIAFKKIRTLEVFNLEEAWQAVKNCTDEELLLVRMLIRDSYGMSLEEIVNNLKKVGVDKTRAAFFELKKEGKRFTTEDVFAIAVP